MGNFGSLRGCWGNRTVAMNWLPRDTWVPALLDYMVLSYIKYWLIWKNSKKSTVAMLGGPCSQHVMGNTSMLNQPGSAIKGDIAGTCTTNVVHNPYTNGPAYHWKKIRLKRSSHWPKYSKISQELTLSLMFYIHGHGKQTLLTHSLNEESIDFIFLLIIFFVTEHFSIMNINHRSAVPNVIDRNSRKTKMKYISLKKKLTL